MSRRIVCWILSSFVFVLVFASIAGAHEMQIYSVSKVGNGPDLQPGTYKVEVLRNQNSAEVSFFREGKLLAKVPATLAKEGMKFSTTEIHSEDSALGRVITKLRLQGWQESLVFATDGAKAN